LFNDSHSGKGDNLDSKGNFYSGNWEKGNKHGDGMEVKKI
jgi:hypothetical protein